MIARTAAASSKRSIGEPGARLRRAGLWEAIAPRTTSILVLVVSALGLLSTEIGIYDDSILLVGARLVGAGRVPYVDFYTHYGPVGYTILSLLVRLLGHPGLALRIGEIGLLAGIATLLHILFRSLQPANPLREYPVPLVLLAFSQVGVQAAFFGFGCIAASLILFLLSRSASREIPAVLLGIAAGAVFAAAALIRPAFAAYGAGALLLLEFTAGGPHFGAVRSPLSALSIHFGAAAAVTLLLWLVFYPGISLSLAFNATIIIPARLVASGDARYLDPDFLLAVVAGSRGLLKAITAGAAVAATMVVWMLATPSRYGRWLAAACVAAGGLLPLLLWPSERPGRDANLLALTLFVLTCSVVLAGRSALGQSPQLRAAATFGLAAAAFGHYFWSRADTSHMALVLALALAGAALLLVSLPVLTGLGLLSLFLFIAFCVERSPVFPAVKLFEHGVVAKIRPWRCTVFPADARDAVAFADAQANPGSCFVAVGSSQAWSSANPTELFLISSRLPYTRWYHYDPGLQSSPAVQAEMERELEASDSRTAVVWRADQFLFDQKLQNLKARSHFDAVFDRLYPITAARFGDYEVRVRSSGSRDVPLPAAEAP